VGSDTTLPVGDVRAAAYTIPTGRGPESDGTLAWDCTTLCAVHVDAGGLTGFGYGYTHPAAARLIADTLAPAIGGLDAMDVPRAWEAMRKVTRNAGHRGLVKCAIGIVDIALWDLKARLLDVSVSTLLGRRRSDCRVYGSGGFTSLSPEDLQAQLAAFVDRGMTRVKMKVGREPASDPDRVRLARDAIGPDTQLFVDANGAFSPATAIDMAHRFADHDIAWFEEPVSSMDLAGLRWVRERVPPGVQVAAGEYGSDVFEFRRLCEEETVDVVQPDPIRCGGFTGFLRAATVCDAFSTPISAHTAQQLAVHAACAAPGVLHIEYFHDHAHVADLLLDGAIEAVNGTMRPDPSTPGTGLALKETDAQPYRVH
jgi:L-alanine-DL-glutamate epimerase-like enolase superfamily enzyme